MHKVRKRESSQRCWLWLVVYTTNHTDMSFSPTLAQRNLQANQSLAKIREQIRFPRAGFDGAGVQQTCLVLPNIPWSWKVCKEITRTWLIWSYECRLFWRFAWLKNDFAAMYFVGCLAQEQALQIHTEFARVPVSAHFSRWVMYERLYECVGCAVHVRLFQVISRPL